MIHVGNVVLYVMGWALFVAGQAQNSIRSKSNGLPSGFSGFRQWLDFYWLDLAHRAFWSGLFYGVIVHKTTATLQAVGFPVTSYMIAGIGGWSANAGVYQDPRLAAHSWPAKRGSRCSTTGECANCVTITRYHHESKFRSTKTMTTPATPATPAPKVSAWKKVEGFFAHVFDFFENDAAHFETAAATAIWSPRHCSTN